jgi:glycine C-acetyltransferase
LSPVQAATVTKAFEIVQSKKGAELRRLLMERVNQMRSDLKSAGLEVIGNPSPIVPVLVGDEALARFVSRELPPLGVIANLVEYPAVAKGNARLRLQMMPTHSAEDVRELAARLRDAVALGKQECRRYFGHCPPESSTGTKHRAQQIHAA